jgi:hypothetical protein
MGIRNRCECSGTATSSDGQDEFIANICPSCLPGGSEVTFNTESFDFTSDFVNRPTCVFLNGEAALLTTSGTGTLTVTVDTEPETFEGTFSLTLVEEPGPQDSVLLTFTGFNEMGELFVLVLIFSVPDEDLTVTSCGLPTNLNSRGTTSSTLNQFTPMKRFFFKGQWHDL